MNIFKHFWRASTAHVLITAFLIGLFAAVLIGLQQTLAATEASVKGSLSVVVFLRDTVKDADVAVLVQSIKAHDPEVVSVNYVSREQAYQEALKDPNLAQSLILLKTNPLPASLTVRYSERAWWERFAPAEKLNGNMAIQDIRWDPQAQAVFRSLHNWRLWLMRLSGCVGMILVVWAFIGLYRFLALQCRWGEIASLLTIGAAGGALAWGLWGMSLRSFQIDVSTTHPAFVWWLPMAIGIVAALGCFGLDVRHAD